MKEFHKAVPSKLGCLMETLLHVGFHKTGSSSIQQTLARIEHPGFAYLWREEPNHSNLIRRSYFSDKPDASGFAAVAAEWIRNATTRRGYGGAAPVCAARARFRAMLAKAARDPAVKRLAISGEGVVRLNREGMLNMRRDIAEVASRTQVLGYMRPLDGYLPSALQELAKHRFVSVEALQAPPMWQVIGRIDAVFGKRNALFLPFAKQRLEQGNVVIDFLTRAGLPIYPDTLVTANEGLGLNGFALLYLHRKWYPNRPAVGIGRAQLDRPFIDLLKTLGGGKVQLDGSLVAAKVMPRIDDFKRVSERIDYPIEAFCDFSQTGIRSEGDLLAPVLTAEFQERYLPLLTGEPLAAVLDEQALAQRLERVCSALTVHRAS